MLGSSYRTAVYRADAEATREMHQLEVTAAAGERTYVCSHWASGTTRKGPREASKRQAFPTVPNFKEELDIPVQTGHQGKATKPEPPL